jgi:hypothetical protein
MTVTELIAELVSIEKKGFGTAPIMLRHEHGSTFTDEAAGVVCLLPYNSREEPARVLIV